MNTSSSLHVRVERKTVEAAGICSFELVPVAGTTLPSFAAGSHIDVHLPNGITRQYSLCNPPAESHRYLIGVLDDPASRGGSRFMHERIAAGDVLTISTPKNHFALAREAEEHLLLAGGIGITPILCMAERLASLGARFRMHYCARSASRMAFGERIRSSGFASQVDFHLDDGDDRQKLDLKALLKSPTQAVHLYVCGPKGFMDAVLGTARAAGWPESHLHYEFFSAGVVESEGDQDFDVRIASTGQVVVVPKSKTVVQALSEAGVQLPTSCEQGVCGTCATRVLEGIPDHRDVFLTPDEQARNDQFMPCCSRAKSRVLVLDL